MVHTNEEIEQQLFILFRRSQAIHVSTRSGEFELDRSIYGILCLLDDEGPVRLGTIAHRFRLDPSTITRQVQAVVRLGLATKTVDPHDRRAAILSLTPVGKETIVNAREHRRKMLYSILGGWTAQQRSDFLAGLRRFNTSVDGWIDAEHEDDAQRST
ncbi:MarR family transcriptional regulator [Nocardioides dubius]|uniref:MarR family transcriptional regulator n=1 Tax=Nocardioides dubius TaxID=317019 RepID=A0ABP4EHT9_9ACTN